MKVRIITIGAAALLACACLGAFAAAGPSAGDFASGVFKYEGTRETMVSGKPVTTLRVVSMFGTDKMEIGLAGNDSAAMNVIKGLKPDDFIKVRYGKSGGRFVLDSIEKYTPKPGEDHPEAYEFVKLIVSKVGGQDIQAVILKKCDKEQKILMPFRKDERGALILDEDIVAQAKKFNAGDYLDVAVTQTDGTSYLKSIRPYEPPKAATFVKVFINRTDVGAALSTVELKKDDKPIILCVRPAQAGGASDPAVLAKARALRANQDVLYKSFEDGGKQWLTDLRPAPPPGETTLTGTFISTRHPGKDNPLKVVLDPVAKNEWKAVFSFPWGYGGRDETKVFAGAVKGDMKNGDVSGAVVGEGGRRFGFNGTAKDGVWTFNCFEITSGTHKAEGSGTLR